MHTDREMYRGRGMGRTWKGMPGNEKERQHKARRGQGKGGNTDTGNEIKGNASMGNARGRQGNARKLKDMPGDGTGRTGQEHAMQGSGRREQAMA